MKEMSFRYLLLFKEVFLTIGGLANTCNANQFFRLVSGSSVCFWVYKIPQMMEKMITDISKQIRAVTKESPVHHF
jgi:hypothetical protein